MKILVLGNQARAMSNFWTVLLRRMTEAGHDVLCVVPHPQSGDDSLWENSLTALGVRLAHYPLDRKGLNPMHDAKTMFALRSLFSDERPDVLFAFTIKPIIYGSYAARMAGYPKKTGRHVMITGLGYMFEADNTGKRVLRQIARLLYRVALSFVRTVIFQNRDDRELFEQLSILPPGIAVAQGKGTGVDLRHFASVPLPPAGDAPVFLFVGRLLEAKGLRELADAARMVKAEFPQARFQLLGPAEKGMGAVPLEEVQHWESEGRVEYLGETHDVRPYLANAHVVVLPSWREGTPCALLEAMSTGRPVVAADAPGSREVVRDGVNGFLVPVHDADALANAVKRFIVEPELITRMGVAGRAFVEEEFSAESVAQSLMRIFTAS